MLEVQFYAAMIIGALAAFWVYNDAGNRGLNGFPWALLTFLAVIIGLPLYLLLRPRGELHQCAWCGKNKLVSTQNCPHCGKKTKINEDLIQNLDAEEAPDEGKNPEGNCPVCSRRTEEDWKFCAYCGNKLDTDA